MKIFPNDLSHHGVLGMKWGVRRYQNKDGSLTIAGKMRYRKSITVRKGQSIYRSNSSDEPRFMNRDYAYVSVTNDPYYHYINTAEGFEGGHSHLVSMESKRQLKIATVQDYISALEKTFPKTLDWNKKMSDIPVKDADKLGDFLDRIPTNYRDGWFGSQSGFNTIMKQLNKDGYDGCIDVVDAINQYRHNPEDYTEVTAMIIFNPSKNLKIKSIDTL